MASTYDVSPAFRLSNGIQLPVFDTREVSSITLENGLVCIIGSDPHTEVSACSVQVVRRQAPHTTAGTPP